jgi:hypothetical protein
MRNIATTIRRIAPNVRRMALTSAAVLCSATIASATPASAQTAPIHHEISSNAQAQAAFDRGLLDYYAYNPEAAEHEFYTAADLDPHAAMAYWGIALSNAPNLNVPPTDDRDKQAARAIAKAKNLEAYATPEDRAFIDAAAARFGSDATTTRSVREVAYRDALQRIATDYPHDPDAAALYAEAALYVAVDNGAAWNAKTPAQREAFQATVAALLPYYESSIATFPDHVGLLHFYIHAAQFAGKSQRAVPAAKQLASFALPPEDSHLTHMPGHTFIELGMYPEALDVAQRSVAMDDAAFACCHPGYYSAPRYYRGHNLSFLLYALTQTGHAGEAVTVARRDGDTTAIAKQLLVAGRWQDVAALPYDKGKSATIAFARGIAAAKLGDATAAGQALAEIPAAPPGSGEADAAWTAALRLTLAGEIDVLAHEDAKALQSLEDASAETDRSNALDRPEIPSMYYYSPHMALAELAMRLGKPAIARAALQAELVTAPNSAAATAALAKLGTSR